MSRSGGERTASVIRSYDHVPRRDGGAEFRGGEEGEAQRMPKAE